MSLPTPPNEGTGVGPLMTVSQYQQITGDNDSNAEDVSRELDEAIPGLSMQMRRTIGYGQYTEDCFLYDQGFVYPSATPIDPTKPIVSGAEDTQAIYNPGSLVDVSSVIQGAGIWVGFFTPLPWMPIWTGVIPPQTVVTYWGGYYPYQADPATIPTGIASLPPKLARIIATVAFYSLHPSIVTTMGANNTALGGISLAGDLSSFMQFDKNLRRLIRSFTKPQAHAWQN